MREDRFYPTGQLVEFHDDISRTVTTYDETGAITSTRPYTADENAAADSVLADAATLTNLAARVARIEAHLWPAPPDPATPDDPTVTDWEGIWPDGGLLRDGGIVWRNVSGVPLTTPPSGFPGVASQWSRLFVAVLTPEPEPEPEESGAQPWAEGVAYSIDQEVTHAGRTWRCKLAHESHIGWVPSAAAWAVWEDLGPA